MEHGLRHPGVRPARPEVREVPGVILRGALDAAAGQRQAPDRTGSPSGPPGAAVAASEALILSNGLFLEAAVTVCRARGLAIPGDVALAGFDDETWTALVQPGVTVIRQPVEAIGQEAMALLLARMERPDLPARKVVLAGDLVPRGSTAPVAG